MPSFTALLATAPRPPLWLEATAYAGRLLVRDAIPWLDVAAAVSWQRKAQGLLRSEVATLPLAPVCEAWLAAHPELVRAMAAKQRAVFAFKTLLADTALRTHLLELVGGWRASFASLPLALVLPAPPAWAAHAYAAAHATPPPAIGEDEADSAAMYLADFLRAFGEADVDALLLEEAATLSPTVAEAAYRSVLNVAAHYRWDAGLHVAAGETEAALVTGFAFVIAKRLPAGPSPNLPAGVEVPPTFWEDGEAPPVAPAGGFRYAAIPVTAQPERVLERLAALR